MPINPDWKSMSSFNRPGRGALDEERPTTELSMGEYGHLDVDGWSCGGPLPMLRTGSGSGENGHTFPVRIEAGGLCASVQLTLGASLADLVNPQDYNLNRSHSLRNIHGI